MTPLPLRILVVDDSSQMRATLRRTILEPEGYQVLTAHDGREALERFEHRASEIDLVISDNSYTGGGRGTAGGAGGTVPGGWW